MRRIKKGDWIGIDSEKKKEILVGRVKDIWGYLLWSSPEKIDFEDAVWIPKKNLKYTQTQLVLVYEKMKADWGYVTYIAPTNDKVFIDHLTDIVTREFQKNRDEEEPLGI